MLLGLWREGPTPASTAELLRVAALSDAAGTFGRAVTEVLQVWEAGRLAKLSAELLPVVNDLSPHECRVLREQSSRPWA